MENYPYNSYPDSGDSSPRSREIEFENPPPWEDQSLQQQSYKAKFMCSYAGKIHPRPHDNQLSYVGGETKILAVDRNIKFSTMIAKLSALCGSGDVSFKYQLPDEDLDSLISVANDDDLEHMMHEYDRLYRASSKPARMRLFVFPATGSFNFGNEALKLDRERFVDALNSGPTPGGEKAAAIPQSKVELLFGLEKGVVPPPPVKIRDTVVEPLISPPPPVPDVIGTVHGLNPGEIQRQIQELQRLQIRDQEHLKELHKLQIREQEQLELAMYRKKAEEAAASMPYTGEYYAQKLPEKVPPMTVQQHVPATAGFWPDKHISSGGFQTTVTAASGPPPLADHPVYMIPASVPGSAPLTLYHAPPRAPAPASGPPEQAGQGYYTNVQRIPHEVYREQPVYNEAVQQQPPPPPTQHQPMSTIPRQVVRSPSGGVTEAAYTQAAAYDRPTYYTAPMPVVPPQYHGVGVAVSGEKRGTVDNSKVVYKVSQGSV
ncbi:hypothetical protein like AT5G64430 [Hibiscus trionum]|uniref:PB1 domain-containing protein n=1 Tax=Hibiscus trionum TaxID=183268 RepID=A0A9W7MGM4_HIBTR|nr:hypothetical protein like AT5G64430 [Hibiscus trionum]